MKQDLTDIARRSTFGLMYLGIAGWAGWRTTQYDPMGEGDILVPITLFCMLGLTSAFCAVGMFIPDPAEQAREAPDEDRAEEPAFDVHLPRPDPPVIPRHSTRAMEWRAAALRESSRRTSDRYRAA